MMFSWLRRLWSHPNSVTEDLGSAAPEATPSKPLRNLTWKEEAELKSAEQQEAYEQEAYEQEAAMQEAWKQKAIEQKKAEQKERARKQVPKPSCDLTIVRDGKCQRCQNLDANDFGPYAYSGISHHDFNDLTAAARKGCNLCGFSSARLGGQPEGRSEMQLERSRGLLNFSYRNQKPKHIGLNSIVLEVVIPEGTMSRTTDS